MAPSFILAIDQGTTSSRAILFDKEGQIRATDQQEFPQYYPQAGWTEHDPDEILQSCLSCASSVIGKAGITKDDIAGIGITNQRETTIVWDKVTGKPLHKAIVWLDLRTAETVAKLTHGHGGKDRFRKKTGLPVSTYFSATKMRWLLDNVPEVKKAAEEDRCAFGTVESWLIYKLTGGQDGGVHITDVSNASRCMLMDLHTLAWDEDICRTLGVNPKMLPEIRSNAEVYGRVKGHEALEGLPISGALGDQHAALLGQGCLEVGSSKNTYGTGCFMLLNTGSDLVPSKHGLLTTIGFKLGPSAQVTYALEGSVACAGRTVQWLRDNLGLFQRTSEVEALAKSVEDSGGMTLVPAFSGLYAPYWRDDARAVAVGMTLYTRKEHICRAALESVAFQTVDVLEAMKQDTGLRLEAMRVDGGMTVNGLLMQVQADLLGVTVMRAKMPEATAMGAAVAAGLGIGFWSKAEDVQGFLEKAGGFESFPPAFTAEQRRREHARWQDAVKRAWELDKWDPLKKGVEEAKLLKRPKFQKVSTLKPEQRAINLDLKVVKLPEVLDGEEIHEVVCGDDTGLVTLRLQPAQFLPCEVGQYVRVQNGRVRMVKGFIRVEIDKWGKVYEVLDTEEHFEVNTTKDISAVEYEMKRVASFNGKSGEKRSGMKSVKSTAW